jgi:hypothetical protein
LAELLPLPLRALAPWMSGSPLADWGAFSALAVFVGKCVFAKLFNARPLAING